MDSRDRDQLLIELLRLAGEDRAADLAGRMLARDHQPEQPPERTQSLTPQQESDERFLAQIKGATEWSTVPVFSEEDR
jgi:streptomycin 6-kinase